MKTIDKNELLLIKETADFEISLHTTEINQLVTELNCEYSNDEILSCVETIQNVSENLTDLLGESMRTPELISKFTYLVNHLPLEKVIDTFYNEKDIRCFKLTKEALLYRISKDLPLEDISKDYEGVKSSEDLLCEAYAEEDYDEETKKSFFNVA